MALTNTQYNTIMKTYEEKQLSSRQLQNERIAYVKKNFPMYQELNHKISSLSLEHANKLLDGDTNALAQLKSSISILRKQKEDILINAGLPGDYLELSYTCSDCKDTGYIGLEKCHCFKQQIINLLYQQSNIHDMLKESNFSHLSYEFYKDEDLLHFENAVKTCKDFIDCFNSDYHNLFFYGTVGTGKSFLSGCIAKELIDRGHSVIYFSSVGLFEKLSQISFDYNAKEDKAELYEDLYSCDLLIIDDLGTELTNNFSSSQFFSCLNERILRKKSFIISTNLSLQELRDRYSDRIFSRITSNFKLCKITGPDIRMYKKRLTTRK
ncbi:MAG: ATP-binding protein [Lachnospiraceae bacterium]|nr:ATP-binding protein [Lachnospiraceae bacterium]